MNRIVKVDAGSIAEEMDIEVGDELLTINERPVVDIIDYMYLTQDDYIVLEIKKPSGELWAIEIEKEFDENVGLTFENPIMDCAKSCSNKCVFCFIDQLPPGMRPSLYFKDDDSRLSFLQGNFVTLTNLKEADIERIIDYRISPINVSVHTTDPTLRKKMLNNRFADQIMPRLKRLTESGITVNAQIVLCPGYNDGAALERTLGDLLALYPGLNSVAVVPIGKTKFRKGLVDVPSVSGACAKDTIARVSTFQARALQEVGTRFVFAADEFYLKACEPFPEDAAYEGYLQFEDGIGMIRRLQTQFEAALKGAKQTPSVKRVSIVTGVSAHSAMCEMVEAFVAVYPEVAVDVHCVVNDFFGEEITVVGLLTGRDIKKTVLHDASEAVLLSEAVFRADDVVLLDDVTREELERHFNRPVVKVKNEGAALLSALLYGGKHE